jgi:hypothetical protein
MTDTMTLNDAMALQPTWLMVWINILLLGAFILPLALLIWKQSRVAGLLTLLASAIAGMSINMLFNSMGYVKLLGLPHLVFWTPLLVFLYFQTKRPDMPAWPRRIMFVVMGVIAISLAFDFVDVARYILGERAPHV